MSWIRSSGSALALATALSTSAIASEAPFNFLYRQGSTVATFEVASPPTVTSFGLTGSIRDTEVTTTGGTYDGSGAAFGSVSLYLLENYGETEIFDSAHPQIDAVGPLSQPLYQGAGNRPAIQRGDYALTTQSGAPVSLAISFVKDAVFTLSGTVNGSFVVGDYPNLVSYGERNGVDYFTVLPMSSDVAGGTIGATTFYADGGFSSAFAGGSLQYGSVVPVQFDNAKLYSGPLYAPLFLPGTYSLGGGETLTIALPNGPPAGVPEPATWLQLLTGFVTVGSILRRNGETFARRSRRRARF